MSWEEYLELPEQPRAEWVDGTAVIMNSPPLFDHGDAVGELHFLLRSHISDHFVVPEVYLQLPHNRVRLPDLMIVAHRPPDGWVREVPAMVAEVLSRSTRSEDLVRKSAEYAEFGIGQYWVVDPELRTLTILLNVDGTWEDLLRLDVDDPEGSVELAGVTIPLDLRQILRG
jgi:Uma2 family endonuclease